MAFTLVTEDDFVGSNGSINGRTPDTLGAVWGNAQGVANGAVLTSNRLTFPNMSNTWIINTTVLSNDQAVEFTYGTGTYNGSLIRASASGDGYLCLINDVGGLTSAILIFEMTAGSFNLINNTNHGVITGKVIRFEMIGTTMEVFYNGVSQLTLVDTTHSSGFGGLFGASDGLTIMDDYKGYTTASAGTTWPGYIAPFGFFRKMLKKYWSFNGTIFTPPALGEI